MKALFTLSTNIIPEMEFERQFMAASGTTLDQARFAMAFIGALLSGFLIRFIPGAKGESSPPCLIKQLLASVEPSLCRCLSCHLPDAQQRVQSVLVRW
jgi:hypothetical protein